MKLANKKKSFKTVAKTLKNKIKSSSLAKKEENINLQINFDDDVRRSLIETFMKLNFNTPTLEKVEIMRAKYAETELPEDIVLMHLLYHGVINQIIHTALEHKIQQEDKNKQK